MQGMFKAGIILVIAYFGLWFYKDQGNTLPLTSDLDVYVLTLGSILIGIFLAVFFYQLLSGRKRRKGRCLRCGIKIPKTEMYCDYHKQEIVRQYRDNISDHKHGR